MFNIQDAIEQAVENGIDMNEAQKGGGEGYTPPAAGPVRLRLVSYIELGKFKDEWQGKERIKEKVALQFELSGPKHPPREFDGVKEPLIMTVNLNLSLSEKAAFYKLFKRMNHTGKFKHMAQMLGEPFIGTIHHKEVEKNGTKTVYANLYDAEGVYTIRPPFREDFETGESIPVEVAPALTPLRCFLWGAGAGLKEMWDSLFIDGMWEARKDDKGNETSPAKSKNHWQNTIRKAVNFAGSPIAELLFAGGEPDLDAAPSEKPERKAEDVEKVAEAKVGAAADPLAGI